MGNYQEAILSFEKVFAFTNSNKDDAAQLKLGLCYMHLNDNIKAKTELQKLINDYPTSEYVSMAKRLIAKIDEGS
jgi:TolA-binding protein